MEFPDLEEDLAKMREGNEKTSSSPAEDPFSYVREKRKKHKQIDELIQRVNTKVSKGERMRREEAIKDLEMDYALLLEKER